MPDIAEPRSVRRTAMKVIQVPAVIPMSRQLKLLFEANGLAGLKPAERSKVRQLLAQILLQAAGLSVEELDDDEH
jgi:hypothetical protein